MEVVTLPIPIARERLAELISAEEERLKAEHPRCLAAHQRARHSLLAGVPMIWMVRWPGGLPLVVREASGNRFVDLDGQEYLDFCLGDTGAMTGHSPAPTAAAIARQAARGLTLMLPTEDAAAVAETLADRFGVEAWQFTLSATDANRMAIRWARALTGRPKVLVFNGCYHGTVDETFATLDRGRVVPRPGTLGPPVPPDLTTRVVEFNDLPALEEALRAGDVACVLAEPVMTNIGIIPPDPGYLEGLQERTRRTGTLLILDETHTLSAGPGGCTGAWGLRPDMVTLGKPLAGGVPVGAMGVRRELAERMEALLDRETSDTNGMGGTLAANALSLAAMRATLEEVLTPEAYARMIAMGERFEAGVAEVIRRHDLPWHVVRLGCRVEYGFTPQPPRSGGEAAALWDHELDRFMHLFMLNRGILLTPFHMMALMAPDTGPEDVDQHTRRFEEAAQALRG